MAELGYRTNAAARAHARNRSHLIGVMVAGAKIFNGHLSSGTAASCRMRLSPA